MHPPHPQPTPASLDGLLRITHIIYALHALSVVTGIIGSATIVGSFAGGIPSLIAVALNYIKRGEVRGTWLDSHFRWQIRTFWFTWLWVAISVFMSLTLLLIPLAVGLLGLVGLWVLYRVVRGWLNLNQRQTMPVPEINTY